MSVLNQINDVAKCQHFYPSTYLYLFHNKPYSTAKKKNSETGRTRITALIAAIRNGKIKTKLDYNKY